MNSQCKLLILHKTSQGQRLCLSLCSSYTTCLWKVYPSVLSGTLMDRPLKLHQEVQGTWPGIYMRLTLGAHHTVSWERSQEVLVWSCPQKNQLPRQTDTSSPRQLGQRKRKPNGKAKLRSSCTGWAGTPEMSWGLPNPYVALALCLLPSPILMISGALHKRMPWNRNVLISRLTVRKLKHRPVCKNDSVRTRTQTPYSQATVLSAGWLQSPISS